MEKIEAESENTPFPPNHTQFYCSCSDEKNCVQAAFACTRKIISASLYSPRRQWWQLFYCNISHLFLSVVYAWKPLAAMHSIKLFIMYVLQSCTDYINYLISTWSNNFILAPISLVSLSSSFSPSLSSSSRSSFPPSQQSHLNFCSHMETRIEMGDASHFSSPEMNRFPWISSLWHSGAMQICLH